MKVSELKRYLEDAPDDAIVKVPEGIAGEYTWQEATTVSGYSFSNSSHDPNEPGSIDVVVIR